MKLKYIHQGTIFALICLALLAAPVAATRAESEPDPSVGVGQVFFPNPVAYLNDHTLTDQDDADYPEIQPAYVKVMLTNLDGSGYLRGDWAYIYKATGPLAYSEDNSFIYDRSDDRFEQVMAYYWITEAQLYIQSLGFGTKYRPINMEPQDVRINQLGLDNSYSWDKFDMLRFGKGGVDDAEDADVILHEYGHAMMDSQSDPFGEWGLSIESGSIGEGFADYVAISITDVLAPSTDTNDIACVADWDAVSYSPSEPPCLRRVDSDLHYPEDLVGQVHHDGMIWSRALWDILQALGHKKADTLILEAVFGFAPDSDMPSAAQVTVDTAERLYGKRAATIVRSAFQRRGILP
jgi:hypothetical protein